MELLIQVAKIKLRMTLYKMMDEHQILLNNLLNLKNLNPLDRAQKSPAAIDDTSAACKFRSVFCHENGTSIHPRGLSIAITDRSS